MGVHKYPIGFKFNKLTIIEYLGAIKNNNHTYYKCQCECGNIINVISGSILKQKSCGCIQNKKIHKKYPDGYKFNKLTILECLGSMEDKHRHTYYKCQCECGNIVNVLSFHIPFQKSCGCIPKEMKKIQ